MSAKSSLHHIDARGLKCPLPVLKAEKQFDLMQPGDRLQLIADDPVARLDVPLLCQKRGYSCQIERDTAALTFLIIKS